MKDFLKYELAPYPLTLFDEVGMRKSAKSNFLQNLKNHLEDPIFEVPSFKNAHYVVDGGFLLHRVVWNKNDAVSEILRRYVEYVKAHYAENTTIVFDGYPCTANFLHTKSAERFRRSRKEITRKLIFDTTMNIDVQTQKFFLK